MEKIFIDCRRLKEKQAAHEYLARELDFPAYYGHNLDALYDLLTTPPWSETEIVLEYPEELSAEESYAAKVAKVIMEAKQTHDEA